MRIPRKPLAPSPRPRIFACLDQQGICRAFHQSAQPPGPARWYEVNEQRLAWLGSRLPESAFTAR